MCVARLRADGFAGVLMKKSDQAEFRLRFPADH
jgi:hypothetical protein